jgi:membrane-bound lytic murein transglycosylase D
MKTNIYRTLIAISLFISACSTQSPLKQDEAVNNGDTPLSSSNPASDLDTLPPDDLLQLEVPSAQYSDLDQVPVAEDPDQAPVAGNDIWVRLRAGLRFPSDYEHPKVQEYLVWHQLHPRYLYRLTKRAEPFLHFILLELEQRGMPYDLALLPAVESAYLAMAYSRGGAAGLWQFIPSTGRHYGLEQNWWYDGRRDIYTSTHAALDYLNHLNQRFNGDWLLTLAAYNAGPMRITKAIERNKREGKPTGYWDLALPSETRNYVPKLLALKAIIEKPQEHGIALWPIADSPVITNVDIGSQIELGLAAELAQMDLDQLHQLNPGFNRWATDPQGPHRLLLPIDKASPFELKLAELPPEQRIIWIRHRIKTGDSLINIAKEYHTTVDHLRHANSLSGNRIVAGKHLLVPRATHSVNGNSYTRLTPRKSKNQSYYHIVASGETLWSISRKYTVSIQDLLLWNDLSVEDTLVNGERLVIKLSPISDPLQSKNRTVLDNSNNQFIKTIQYSVKQGDSLYRIAKHFKVNIADLRRWNDLTGSSLLHPGQKVKVHVDLTRQSSDS